MTRATREDVMATVARRADVLRAVDPEGVEKRDLVDRLDVSRSTVDRAVRELEGARLVDRTDAGYRRTLAGRLVLAEYEAFAARVAGVVDAVDGLEALGPDAPVDAAVFEGAEVVRAGRHAPDRPVTAVAELVEAAGSLAAYHDAVYPRLVDAYEARVVDGDRDATVVAPEPVVERLLAAYPDRLREGLASGRLELVEAAETVPFGVVRAEVDGTPVVGVTVAGDAGPPAFVRNDDPEAVAWADALLDRLRAAGADLTSEDGAPDDATGAGSS